MPHASFAIIVDFSLKYGSNPIFCLVVHFPKSTSLPSSHPLSCPMSVFYSWIAIILYLDHIVRTFEDFHFDLGSEFKFPAFAHPHQIHLLLSLPFLFIRWIRVLRILCSYLTESKDFLRLVLDSKWSLFFLEYAPLTSLHAIPFWWPACKFISFLL